MYPRGFIISESLKYSHDNEIGPLYAVKINNNSLRDVKWPNLNHSCVFKYIVCRFGCICLVHSCFTLSLFFITQNSTYYNLGCIAVEFALYKFCLMILLNYTPQASVYFYYIYFFGKKYIVIFSLFSRNAWIWFLKCLYSNSMSSWYRLHLDITYCSYYFFYL